MGRGGKPDQGSSVGPANRSSSCRHQQSREATQTSGRTEVQMQRRLVVWLTAILAALGGASAQSEIRIAIPGEGDTLDPAYMSFVNSFAIATNIYSGLVRYAPGTIDLVPDLATSWEVSEDGLTWTFHISDDVVWPNVDSAR